MVQRRYRLGFALPVFVLLASLPGTRVLGQGVQAPPPKTSPKRAPAEPAQKAAQSDSALPAARSIIDRHIKAVGGRAAFTALSSTHATGTVSIAATGMMGSIDVFAAKPDKTLVRITFGGIGAVEEGFDGKVGWSINPLTGPTLAEGKELDQKRFNSDFLADLHADERFESMRTLEKTDFEGRQCYKLQLVRRGGGEDIEFYDVETGLKAGSMVTHESPMGPMKATTIETDYKKFGPLLMPTTFKATTMGVQQVITVTSVEYNKVDAATFEAPAQIKALLK
jgi:hypothetical protein